MFELVAGNSELAELITKASDTDASINGADKVRYWAFTNNFTRAFENAYFQWTDGALDPSQWAGMKRMTTDFGHIPGFQEYWANRKHWYSEEFQHYMDTEIMRSDAKAGVPLPGDV